jgi:hypothetical protein
MATVAHQRAMPLAVLEHTHGPCQSWSISGARLIRSRLVPDGYDIEVEANGADRKVVVYDGAGVPFWEFDVTGQPAGKLGVLKIREV